MNKREKRLLIATLAVVGVWLLTLMIGSDAPVANADQEKPAKPIAAAPAPAAPTPTPAAEGTPGQADSPVVAYRFRPEQLEALVEVRRTAALFVPVDADPFGPLRVVIDEGSSADKKNLPVLSGLYRSGGAKGALLNGKVCFEGEQVFDGDKPGPYKLIEVTADKVVLERDGEAIDLLYDPLRSRPPKH
ncbi:MAG: hypothetical protein AAF581_11370 [Planctomycetota bacterium]